MNRFSIGLTATCIFPVSFSSATTLDFKGLKVGESVSNYYNGGSVGDGSVESDAVNYVIGFHHPAVAIISKKIRGTSRH